MNANLAEFWTATGISLTEDMPWNDFFSEVLAFAPMADGLILDTKYLQKAIDPRPSSKDVAYKRLLKAVGTLELKDFFGKFATTTDKLALETPLEQSPISVETATPTTQQSMTPTEATAPAAKSPAEKVASSKPLASNSELEEFWKNAGLPPKNLVDWEEFYVELSIFLALENGFGIDYMKTRSAIDPTLLRKGLTYNNLLQLVQQGIPKTVLQQFVVTLEESEASLATLLAAVTVAIDQSIASKNQISVSNAAAGSRSIIQHPLRRRQSQYLSSQPQ